MPYKFTTQSQDYLDFSSGRVIYNSPGMAAFPVRLTSEIFQRARAALPGIERLNLYDPTCGAAYHLTALGFLHGDQIASIYASDIDPRAVDAAQRNLNLLTPAGLNQRKTEIQGMLTQYAKESHGEALKSVAVLRSYQNQADSIATRVFLANALDAAQLRAGLSDTRIDLVVADVPYGSLTKWQATPDVENSPDQPPVWLMLDALQAVLPKHAVVAVAADKSQAVAHEGFTRIERFQVGKRRVTLIRSR